MRWRDGERRWFAQPHPTALNFLIIRGNETMRAPATTSGPATAGALPRVSADSAAHAREAARLAAKHPGKKFLVLTGWAKYVAVPDSDEHHVTTHRRAFAQEAA